MSDPNVVMNKTDQEDEFVVVFSEVQCDCGST